MMNIELTTEEIELLNECLIARELEILDEMTRCKNYPELSEISNWHAKICLLQEKIKA